MNIAIVLITYNHEKYIYDALLGIYNQVKKPSEVIIADDYSTDSTREIINEFIISHNLIGIWKTIYNSQNYGITKNLKNAIDKIEFSDIVITMAGDDISLPNRCVHAINLFKKYPDLIMIAGSIYKINSSGEIVGKYLYNNEIKNNITIAIKNGTPNVFPVGVAFKRKIFDIFGALPTDVPNEDDQLIFWGILYNGIFCSSEIVAKYRIHDLSASSWIRDNLSGSEFYDKFIADMPIRQRHMELWQKALIKYCPSDYNMLNNLIGKKVEVYSFLGEKKCHLFHVRLKFLMSHISVVGLRESYYILLGKFGIISWRYLRNIIKGKLG